MIRPPFPHDEADRLEALFEYQILDTAPERDFDELTELVSQVMDVPIALVSLVDETRQWFKARYGLAVSETPREYAFCAHAILQNDMFIVEDSHKDERFSDNALVTGDPHVRFYAGMPLITPKGYKIGTICGIDHVPRKLDANQQRILEIASRQVVAQLELRKNIAIREDLFREQNRILQQLESANQEVRDFVSVVSHDLRAPVLNMIGFSEELALSTKDINDLANRFETSIPVEFHALLTQMLEDDFRDSIAHIQRSAAQMNERIGAVSTVAKHGRRQLEPEYVDLGGLIAEIGESHSVDLKKIGGRIDSDGLPAIYADKVSVQLIVENIISNAVKYSAAERPLRIQVSADAEPDGLLLHFTDNGRGIAADDIPQVFVMFRRLGAQDTEGDGTGLAFCRTIANRLGGNIWCDSTLGSGSTFHVLIPQASIGTINAVAGG